MGEGMLSSFSDHLHCEINQPQLDSTDATYLSKFSTTELLKSISFQRREQTCHLNNSQFYSILAYESSDFSSKEELAIYGG